MNKKMFSYLSLILFFVVIGVNYFTAIGKIPGLLPQKEVSGLFSTPITPAGFTFSIWGVIYFTLFLSLLYLLKLSYKNRKESKIVTELMMPLFGIYMFNIAWNIVFGYSMIGVSVFMILGYFICLIEIGIKLSSWKATVNPILFIAFGLHTGWIAIASIVNIYAYLVKIKFSFLMENPEFWIVIGIVTAVLLVAFLQVILRNNPFLPLATAWALFGIYAEAKTYTVYPFLPLLLLAGICILVLMAAMAFFVYLKEVGIR